MAGITFEIGELLDYSDHERAKWKQWVAADPTRLVITFQPAGRFPTLGALLDHLFLVERRHLSRLEGGTPPEATGVAPGDWNALFEYADLVRADFRRYVADVDDAEARERLNIVTTSATQTMSRRRLVTHVLLHEVWHLGQLAYAARLAGHEPPGKHDLFYFPET